MNKPHNNKGIHRLINATQYSLQGLKSTFATEAAFREECYLAIVALPLSFWIADTVIEWLLLITSLLLILVVEIINSAIEAVVDRFGGEIHALSKKAKDAGSAAVALAIVLCLLTWGTILIF